MRTASLTVHRYCLPHSNIGTSLSLSYSEDVEVFAAFVWLFSLYEKKRQQYISISMVMMKMMMMLLFYGYSSIKRNVTTYH